MALAFMPKRDSETGGSGERLQRRAAPCFVILDTEYAIVSAEPRLEEFLKEVNYSQRPHGRLPAAIERAVRSMVGKAFQSNADEHRAVSAALDVFIQACVLTGPAGACIAVTLERLRQRDPLGSAAVRFNLTRREREVLSLILEGLEGCDIAARLGIATHTVGEYFKHLHRKIGANNRSAMLARVFQWPENPL